MKDTHVGLVRMNESKTELYGAHYQCEFDADLNGSIRVEVDYGSSIIGTVNTLIDKSQII